MYKKVKRDQVPKRERKSESLFEVTPDWKRMKSDIDRGIPKGESVYFQFLAADWKRIGLSGKPMAGRNVASGCYAIQRFIKQYLQTVKKKYTVRVQSSDGSDLVIVDGPE